MTRQEFISRLSAGLVGIPERAHMDIVADYQAHFTEGAAAGRSEADVAAALGDPDRLARELKAETGLKRWESERNPEAAAAAIFAILGLGAIDVLVLLPILVGVVSALCAFAIAAIAIFIGGAVVFAVGPFAGGVSIPGAMLAGLGMMASAVCCASLLTLISIGLVNGLVWYGRLHYRLLKPAIDPAPTAPREFATP
ncbi:MAG TPA: DUF1700 domain-containing protein [Caulobacteraceae bacterium]|jgi:uncharacterized membrane protein|nr:DUF1700 domain-containing protein [Caulobacteraceae bacterium]